MIDTDKYEGHTEGPWCYYHSNQFIETEEGIHLFTNCGDIDDPAYDANSELVADAPLLLEFIQKVVEEWGKPNQCNKAFGKDVRYLMLEYGLINFNEETRRYEVKE